MASEQCPPYLQACPRCETPDAVEVPMPGWTQPPCCKDCETELAYENSSWCTVCQKAVENPGEDGEINCACS